MNKKNEYFLCPECGFAYRTKAFAEACRRWCRKHKSCNLAIIKHAAASPQSL